MLVFISAAIYGYGFLQAEISAWRSFWKTVPVALMAAFSAVLGAPILLVAALALSAIGDFFLSRDERRFTLGLGAFLVAHVLYIALFWQSATPRFHWLHLVMLVYALGFGAVLWPRTGRYRLAVLAYIFVITAMVSAALFLPKGHAMPITGSFVFAFSDSVLAIEMFVITKPAPTLPKLVWISYIAAQSLITLGFV